MSWDLPARAPVCQVISPGSPPPELGMKGLYVGKGTLPMEVIPGYPRGPGAT